MLRREDLGVLTQMDLNHVSDNGQSHFVHTGLDKHFNRNQSCKILLAYYPRNLTPQSPAGQGAGLGPGIGNRVGTLNHAQD